MCPLHSVAFLAHLSQCKASAKQQVNGLIDAIYAKVLLDLELWLNKHECNDSIKNEIDSDWEENATDHNLPIESQFEQSTEASNDQLTNTHDHHNNLQNEVSLSNTINTQSMIKQELDEEEEDGEEIDDVNVAKCEKGNTSGNDAEMGENGDESSNATQHSVHAASENIQTNQLIIPNDISIDESSEGQNTQIQTDEYCDNHDYSYGGGEDEHLNNPNCEDYANGVCDLDHENINNNHLNNDVPEGDGDEADIETNLDEAQSQIDISITNINQIVQNDKQIVINEKSVCERNMEQSTLSNSGARSLASKGLPRKVFQDAQFNVNPRNSRKRKRDQSNESLNKVKRRSLDDDENTDSDDNEVQDEVNGQINFLESSFDPRATIGDHGQHNSDESMVIQQQERDANIGEEIGEEIATEFTTNPIQPNRHLQCPHCLKSFYRSFNLQRHLRVHTGERPFQCDQCDKQFSQIGNLTTHQLIHRNIKSFRCHECGKQFTQKHTLDSHLLQHSGERPFQCRHCAKSFKTLGHRNSHEQAIHLHVKPYRCKQCGHTATKRSSIITHIRVVHFGLPPTIKEQRALNIIDDRDPRELIEKV